MQMNQTQSNTVRLGCVCILPSLCWAQISSGQASAADGGSWIFLLFSPNPVALPSQKDLVILLVLVIVVAIIWFVRLVVSFVYEMQFEPHESDDRAIPSPAEQPPWLQELVACQKYATFSGTFSFNMPCRSVEDKPVDFQLKHFRLHGDTSRIESRGSDVYGKFTIYGRLTADRLTFRKSYTEAATSQSVPVYYQGSLVDGNNGTFRGTWQFVDMFHDPKDDGTFELSLQPDILPAELTLKRGSHFY
jgi:hypothetical protein